MRKLTLKLFLVCLLCSSGVTGLKCFNCVYQNEENDGKGSKPSCQAGSVPVADLSLDCESLDYIPVAYGKELFVPTSSLPGITLENLSEIAEIVNWSYSCFSLDFRGMLLTRKKVNITIRSCLARPSQSEMRNLNRRTSFQLPEKCYSGINSEIERRIEEDDIKAIAAVLQPLFMDNAEAKVCNCNEDNCNGDKDKERGETKGLVENGASNLSKISSFLSFLPAFLYIFTYFVNS